MKKGIYFRGQDINIIGIDENYTQINSIEILDGIWPTEKNQIIISEKFAKERNEPLFIGDTINILEKRYIIVGIYENAKYPKIKTENLYVIKGDIPEDLEEDGKVFYSLEFRAKDTNRKKFIKEQLLEDIKIILDEEQTEIKIIDFTETGKNLSKYYYGFIFLFEISTLIFITDYIIQFVKLNIKDIKKRNKRKYGKEIFLKT